MNKEAKTDTIYFKLPTALKLAYLDYCNENETNFSDDLRDGFIYPSCKSKKIEISKFENKIKFPKEKDNSITFLIEPTIKFLFQKTLGKKKASKELRKFIKSRVALLNEKFEYCKK